MIWTDVFQSVIMFVGLLAVAIQVGIRKVLLKLLGLHTQKVKELVSEVLWLFCYEGSKVGGHQAVQSAARTT